MGDDPRIPPHAGALDGRGRRSDLFRPTANGFVVSVTYFDDTEQRAFNLRKEEARPIAVAISRLPELLATDKWELADEHIRPGSGLPRA
jgi:hypothetical protein